MKKNLYIILICSLISACLHLYLSNRSYSLSNDKVTESSLCHVNNQISCDNVLVSKYSDLLGIPISNWGFATHLIILLISLLLMASLVESISLMWLIISGFSLLSAGASLIMLGLSTLVLKSFCPICIVLYLLSFIVIPFIIKPLKEHFSIALLKEKYLFFLTQGALYISIAFLSHLVFINAYDLKSSKKAIKFYIMDWQSSPVKKTKEKPLLTAGPSKKEAIATITEFADFLCSHCKNNHYILKIIKASHPQVRVEYFSFPLDMCKSNRSSCFLTRSVHCAEKQNQGWSLHGIIFEHQKKFIPIKSDEVALQTLKGLSQDLKLKWDEWLECIDSPEAVEVQNKQIEAGENMNVTSTPSVFVNEKKISHRYFSQSMQIILQQLKNKHP